MTQATSVLALFAHPDDAEFLCAGTLACLAQGGANIHIATMTAGDCGSAILSPAKIARIRRQEATRAAALIGAEYVCLEEKDLLILYDRPTLRRVMEVIRRVDPALVMTHSPVDYMVDHETTSRLCQTACFGASAANFRTAARKAAPPIRSAPHLYYAQPFGGRDVLGKKIQPSLYVDIGATIDRKEKMLAGHESQRAWLRAQQAISDPLVIMRKTAEETGQVAGVRWAEGFRQHLGQGFPEDNLLGKLLGSLVRSSAGRTPPMLQASPPER
jgi:LmbE family N-acetylglucosaminyl deacetylase